MLGIGILLGMIVTVLATRVKRIYPIWAIGFGSIAAVLLTAKFCTSVPMAWAMRCRTQGEMDALVEEAGFEKIMQLCDEDDISVFHWLVRSRIIYGK